LGATNFRFSQIYGMSAQKEEGVNQCVHCLDKDEGMGVGSGRLGGVPPWIFKHGTNIVDRGLKVLFRPFLLFSVFFPLPPLSPRKVK